MNIFYSEELLAFQPPSKLEDEPLMAVLTYATFSHLGLCLETITCIRPGDAASHAVIRDPLTVGNTIIFMLMMHLKYKSCKLRQSRVHSVVLIASQVFWILGMSSKMALGCNP
jgi:hypothetical protein